MNPSQPSALGLSSGHHATVVQQGTEDAVALDEVSLGEWFAENGRDLPWRHSRDPWLILVSELMLQQTQVTRVIDRLPQFLARFPTVSDCAVAAAGAVIEEWKGLGYNRRAVNLHRAAIQVTHEHGGVVPDDLAALLALPGIGPYTARAVLAFAFEHDVGVVDTNIARVLARTSGTTLRAADAQRLADQLVPPGQGWLWNQALMEVGALHCRPQPTCETCTLRQSCAWTLAGQPAPDPATGSAGVSKGQSRFEGSDRQGRGRLIDALRNRAVVTADLAAVMGWDDDPVRAEAVASTLLNDGLAVVEDDQWKLP